MAFEVRYCIICRKMFIPRGNKQKCCSPECTDINRRNQRKSLRNERDVENTNPTVRRKSIEEFNKEVEAYNKKHGTHLSYGKYELKKQLEAKSKAKSDAIKKFKRILDTGASEEEIVQFMKEFGGAR